MKYYKMTPATSINGVVPPGLNGKYVKGKKEFFDNNQCGPDRFYDKDYGFDYLVPMEFGAGNPKKESHAIYDYHSWWGEAPVGGWLKPLSKHMKEVLAQFQLGTHRFYPAWVLFQNQKHDYFVMQIFRNDYQKWIDFDKTVFNNLDSVFDLEDRTFETKQFETLAEVWIYAENHWGSSLNWNYERIVMKSDFPEIDFFTMYPLGDIVSERLKEAIQKAGLLGMEFEELPVPLEW